MIATADIQAKGIRCVRDRPGKKASIRKALFFLLLKICVFVLAGWAILSYVLIPYRMGDNNMFPFVKDGDLCFFYTFSTPYVGDVILYHSDNARKVGRIVAKSGQTITFPDAGGYTVNEYTPAEFIPYDTYGAKETDVKFPLTIGDDESFVLNDYRERTDDGREEGALKKSEICGKLIFILRIRDF